MKIFFIIISFTLILISTAKSEDYKNNFSLSSTNPKNNKISFKSTSLTLDENKKIITLFGNVEINFNDNKLKSDSLILNQKNNSAFAKGNVIFFDNQGNTFYTNEIELSKNFTTFFVSQIYSRLSDGSQFKAKELSYQNTENSIYENSRFTPCKCDWNNEEEPIWYFSANVSSHNQKTNTIKHEGVSMYLFDFPIFYFPIFAHPDWTVKRRSGFLAPDISFGSEGLNYSQPIYYANSPHNDITLIPKFFPNSNFLGEVEYRQMFNSGNLLTRFIGGEVDTITKKSNKVVATFLEYDAKIDKNLNLKININETSENSFLKKYKIFNENIIKSSVVVNKINKNEFAEMEFSKIESLSNTTSFNNYPRLLPSVSYEKHFKLENSNILGELNLNGLILKNDQDIDLMRYSASIKGHSFLNTRYGRAFSEARLLTNLYDITNNNDPTKLGNINTVNSFLTVGFENYNSLIINNNLTTLEPRIQLVTINGSDKIDEIPNLDASDYRIDENNLFFPHRPQGKDLIFTGGRIDYGLKIFNTNEFFGKFSGFFGQSYNLWGKNEKNYQFINYGDTLSKQSDFLTKLTFQPSEKLSFDWNGRLNPKSLELNESTSKITQKFEKFSLSTSHSTISEGYLVGANGAETLNFSLNGEFLEDWNLSAFQNYDLHSGNQKLLNGGFELNYSGYLQDCLEVQIQYNKHTKTDASIAPNDEVALFLKFKYLGELIDPINILN